MSQFNFALALKDESGRKTNRHFFILWEFAHIKIEKWKSCSNLFERQMTKTKTFLLCINWNSHTSWFGFYKPLLIDGSTMQPELFRGELQVLLIPAACLLGAVEMTFKKWSGFYRHLITIWPVNAHNASTLNFVL